MTRNMRNSISFIVQKSSFVKLEESEDRRGPLIFFPPSKVIVK